MFEKPIILFDGVCNLCNRTVDFIMKRDSREIFIFATSQSESGKEILSQFGRRDSEIASVCLVDRGNIYEKSTAVLRILNNLPFPWHIAYFFIVVPRPVRDFFYDVVARNRYRWFGRREVCRVPDEREKDRFVVKDSDFPEKL